MAGFAAVVVRRHRNHVLGGGNTPSCIISPSISIRISFFLALIRSNCTALAGIVTLTELNSLRTKEWDYIARV